MSLRSTISGLALATQLGCTTDPSALPQCQEQVSTTVAAHMTQTTAMIRGRIMHAQAQPFTDTLKLVPPSGNYYLGTVSGFRVDNTFVECHQDNKNTVCQTGTISGTHPGSVSDYTQLILAPQSVSLETPASIHFETISTDSDGVCAATDGNEWGSASCTNAQQLCTQAISDVSADIQAVFHTFDDRSKP